jgi:hypothetical protein
MRPRHVTSRRSRTIGLGLGLATTLAPGVAAACASCVASAYGDRTFNWAYGGLMLAPFLVLGVVGAVLGWNAGYRLRWRRPERASRPSPASGPIPVHEERP